MAEKIDVKIGTKEEAIWDKILKEADMLIKTSEDNLIVQRAMKELAEQKIKEEQA